MLNNAFWVFVGVGITLLLNQRKAKSKSKKSLITVDKPVVLNNDFENTHRIEAPYTKTAFSDYIKDPDMF